MAKALKVAALVVGAAALVATGIGAAAGAGLLGAAAAHGAVIAGIATASTFTTVGALAGVAAAVLSTTAALTAPKASLGGSATKFTIDKESGIPVVFGRTYVGGRVVHRQYYGSKNSMESWVTVLSLGPVRSLGPLLVDKTTPAVVNGQAQGGYAGCMWLDEQLGACPEPRALAGPQGPFPGWDATSRLSGLAADLWTLLFDTKGKAYPNGVPERGRIVEGMFVYDPRQDSTFPGGDGACRLGDEATYVWSENPACHAVTWAFGRYQNGVLVAGGGLDLAGINLAPFAEWANVCDANGWKVGGVMFTDADNTWDVLKSIAQAGGGEVMPVGALLSCTFSAPRVSIGTITSADIIGEAIVPSTASRRTRRNTVIPTVNLESHGWAMTPLDAIAIPDYVAVDGGSRPLPLKMPLVQQVDQGAQLGLYALFDGRELDGIVLPGKVYLLGYLPGDCLTVDVPEIDLVGRDVVVRNREIDGATAGVTLTCRTETAGKHAFALGHGGSAPPTPDLTTPIAYPVQDAASEQVAIATSFPIGLTIMAADDGTITIGDHTRRYTDGHPDVAVTGATIASGLTAGQFRAICYDDPDRVGGAVAYVLDADDIDARASPTHPGRHYVGYVTVPTAGSPPAGGGGANPPGGYCVTVDTPIMMMGGGSKPAGEIAVGDRLWTRHEASLAWGVYPVEAVETVDSDDVWEATVGGRPLRATGDHLVYTGTWVAMRAIGRLVGSGRVVKMTVTTAHTYVSNGILSHNIKSTSPEVDP